MVDDGSGPGHPARNGVGRWVDGVAAAVPGRRGVLQAAVSKRAGGEAGYGDYAGFDQRRVLY
jgi:hypothetical protein